ncbi:MAG: 2'-5' RNA ligase family protein [Caulobacteraceae bacterium]
MTEQLTLAGFDAEPRDRLLFVILPDADAAAQIAGLAREKRGEHRLRGRPLAAERLHITLHHLGDYDGLPRDRVAAARRAAETVFMPTFDIVLDRTASFSHGERNRPFVLLGSDGVAALMAFQHALGGSMTRAGLGRWVKSQFTPHVTMLYDDQNVEEQTVEPVSWTAREFFLVHSQLGQTRHIVLGQWPLRG